MIARDFPDDLIERARWFLAYAGDRRAPVPLLSERFQLNQETAWALARRIEEEAANAGTS